LLSVWGREWVVAARSVWGFVLGRPVRGVRPYPNPLLGKEREFGRREFGRGIVAFNFGEIEDGGCS
jgi:hypothetical protein